MEELVGLEELEVAQLFEQALKALGSNLGTDYWACAPACKLAVTWLNMWLTSQIISFHLKTAQIDN